MKNKLKIASFRGENIRKIDEIEFNLNDVGLTTIGGTNESCKSTIIEFISSMLRNKVSEAHNYKTKGETQNRIAGIVKFKNGWEAKLMANSIKVKGEGVAEGSTASIFKELVSDFSLDISHFIHLSSTEKTKMLLEALGVKDDLTILNKEKEELAGERVRQFNTKETKKKAHDDMVYYDDVPEKELDTEEILAKHKVILLNNGENEKLRNNVTNIENSVTNSTRSVEIQKTKIADLDEQLAKAKADLVVLEKIELDSITQLEKARKSTKDLKDDSEDEIKAALREANTINSKVRANIAKQLKGDEYQQENEKYKVLDKKVKDIVLRKKAILSEALKDHAEIQIIDDEIHFDGFTFNDLSTSKQTYASIVLLKRINPNAGFAFIDKLENFDDKSKLKLNELAIANDLQLLTTEVSRNELDTGFDVTLMDGKVISNNTIIAETKEVAKPETEKVEPVEIETEGDW